MNRYRALIIFIFLCILPCQQAAAQAFLDGDPYQDLILFNSSSAKALWRASSTGALTVTDFEAAAGRVGLIGDFDGNNTSDISLYDRATSNFYTVLNGNASESVTVGNPGDLPVIADYDGAGCTNYATYDKKDAQWTVADCDGQNAVTFTHGSPGAIAVPGDYDCDGAADAMTYNRVTNEWRLRRSSDLQIDNFYFGLIGDIPASADWDGDGCVEAAVYRPSTNSIFYNSSYVNGQVGAAVGPLQWGLNGDKLILSNVDQSPAADRVIYRPWTNEIFINTSLDVFYQIPMTSGSFSSAANLPSPVGGRVQEPGPAPGDYDGDGRSDYVTAVVNDSANTTTFNVRHSTGAQSSYVVNDQGDALVPADYNGDGKTQAATVYVRVELVGQQNPPPLRWKWLNPDGTQSSIEHGVNGDIPIAGDFDCDGKADPAVVRNTNGQLYWFIELSTGPSVTNYAFGLAGDRIYAADVTGNGCDDLIVARDVQALGGIVWYYREISSGSAVDHSFQWGLLGDSDLEPVDLNGDGRADFIVVRNVGGAWYFYRRYAEGIYDVVPFGIAATDKPLSGRYSGVNYSEIGVYRPGSTSTFYVRNYAGTTVPVAWGASTHSLVRPDGSVVAGQSGGGSGGPGCNPSPGTDTDFVDGGGGAVWKPESDSTGNTVILLPSNPYCGLHNSQQLTLTILGSSGDVVASVASSHCNGANDNRPHFFLNKNPNQMDDFAPITVKVEYNGTTECRVVPNPHVRYD
ncbi:MAG: VCBS repeat-containing protein [Bdellovibrionales bacterium]|nr:VCBS repeat-containing protein [Bdellovibrionales bacterium]